MNYQRTKPRSPRAAKIGVAVIIVLVLLRFIVPHAFNSFFVGIFSPLWNIENLVTRSGAQQNQFVFSSDSAFASSTVAELLQENNDLKDMLGRGAAAGTVLATVLSKPPFQAYDTIIVDAGSEQGVQVGDMAYALADPVVYSTSGDLPPSASTSTLSGTTTASTSVLVKGTSKKSAAPDVQNGIQNTASTTLISASTSTADIVPANPEIEIPIGNIVAVYGASSVVSLFSSPGQTYQVEIGEYRITAQASAQGSGMFYAMVPNNSNINIGDPVIVPGIETGVFASVVAINSDPARPFSLVIFQTPVDPFSLYYVDIVKAGNEAK